MCQGFGFVKKAILHTGTVGTRVAAATGRTPSLSLSRLLADGSPWYCGTKERNERWLPMAMATATATSTVAALDFRRHAAK